MSSDQVVLNLSPQLITSKPSLFRYKDDEFSKRVSALLAVNLPLAVLGIALPRAVSKYFDISIFNSKEIAFFANMTQRLMEERKNTSVVYNDFIGVYS